MTNFIKYIKKKIFLNKKIKLSFIISLVILIISLGIYTYLVDHLNLISEPPSSPTEPPSSSTKKPPSNSTSPQDYNNFFKKLGIGLTSLGIVTGKALLNRQDAITLEYLHWCNDYYVNEYRDQTHEYRHRNIEEISEEIKRYKALIKLNGVDRKGYIYFWIVISIVVVPVGLILYAPVEL